MSLKKSRTKLYAVLAISPILLLSGCKPVDWVKEKLGMSPSKKVKKYGKSKKRSSSKGWVVKVGDEVVVSDQKFEDEFNLLLEEKPQLKSMLPLMPNLEKDFARGLGNQEIITRYIQEHKLDQKSDYLAKKERMERAVIQMLNTEFFAQSFKDEKLSDSAVKKFYEDNKDTMQGILISRGGVNTVAVSFEKKSDADAFCKRAKSLGSKLDIEKLAKNSGLSDKVRDFKMVNGQSYTVEPVLRTKLLSLKKFPTVDVVAVGDDAFWVVHAISKEEAQYRPFDQVKDGVRSVAEQTEKGKQLQKELEKLAKNYSLEINDSYFAKKTAQAEAQLEELQRKAELAQAAQNAPQSKTA